jgi:hypothetical protein
MLSPPLHLLTDSLQLASKLLKIVVVGDLGTGKTSFLKKLVNDTFSLHYKSTVCLFSACLLILFTLIFSASLMYLPPFFELKLNFVLIL